MFWSLRLCFCLSICSWLTILVLLVYTGLVIVVLLNVLIAQLSYTYSEAKNNAKLQYSIDRMSIIARIEQWPFFVSMYTCSRINRILSWGFLFYFLFKAGFHSANIDDFKIPSKYNCFEAISVLAWRLIGQRYRAGKSAEGIVDK